MNLRGRIDALADALAANGELTDEGWRAALHAVPRHLFVPAVAWAEPYAGPGYRIDRDTDPDAWWDAVYADHPIITQLDDGATEVGGGEGVYSSSLSAPGVVVDFLELLSPYAGDRVLEIGTGTGWTAGLLSHRLGEVNVVSVEIDPAVHEAAAASLKQAGFCPRLVLGDGADGWAEQAPYDRVHVTCGVRKVPYAWVEQTRPGGAIVLPWMPGFEPGHKLWLTAGRDGTATGRFAGGAHYMMMRAQRVPAPPEHEGGYGRRAATVDPRRVLRAGLGADVAIAGFLPDVSVSLGTGEEFEIWLWAGRSGAWITGSEVRQFGERNLWDEVEEAFFRWVEWGSPGRDRFGLTVAPDGQHIWLDRPDNVIR
ncbi:methyltransferase domain-containing protein [Microbispora triticiradicis]|uniref:Protein-L-isoaspartate O-methyltransferase n=2 Tax=Microbispora TaxID=2005 RepID=A0ABY3LS87_9ACTN|nr:MULTISPECIES: methyltransferase domain-containing protein [Microbispora]TLP64067.1 methyltransferase domain-containing protein [Microbispora fusca]TYB51882.1 methyltransferase domain-containing protein [Microbispora tritici]